MGNSTMKKLILLLLFIPFVYCDSKSNLKVDNTIEQTFSDYVEYWSEGDFDKIVKEIYNAIL